MEDQIAKSQRRLFAALEKHLWEPPPSRARRYLEDTKSLLPETDEPAKMLVALHPLAGFIVPAFLVARLVEKVRQRRFRSRLRREARRSRMLLEAFRQSGRPPQSVQAYREPAFRASGAPATAALEAELAAADEVVLVHFAVRAPEPTRPARLLQGAAVVALRNALAKVVVGSYTDVGDPAIGALGADVERALKGWLPVPLRVETWNWTRGDYASLRSEQERPVPVNAQGR